MRAGWGSAALVMAASAFAPVPAHAAERPPVVGVSHIAFHVSDVAKARAFYGGLLGYEEVAGKASPDGRVRFRINGRQYVAVGAGGRIAQTTSYARLTKTDIPLGSGSIWVFALPE